MADENDFEDFEDFDLDDLDENDFDENDFKDIDFGKIKKIVNALEDTLTKDYSSIQILEKFDIYASYTKVLIGRVKEDSFGGKLKHSQRKILLQRLKNLQIYFIIVARLNAASNQQLSNFSNIVSKVHEEISNEIGRKELSIEEKLKSTKEELSEIIQSEKDDIDAIIQIEKDEMSQLEHNTLSHVLSLMGIFSAVITLIMSVVLTSTAWLNNANGASALIAFVVPNMVALLSISVLLSFIYLYTRKDNVMKDSVAYPIKKNKSHANSKATDNKDNSHQENDQEINIEVGSIPTSHRIKTGNRRKHGKVGCYIAYITIYVGLITILLSAITLKYANEQVEQCQPHMQYVISEAEYTIVDKEIPNMEPKKFFCFELDKIKYECEYNEVFIHDGNLYYCKDHSTLE